MAKKKKDNLPERVLDADTLMHIPMENLALLVHKVVQSALDDLTNDASKDLGYDVGIFLMDETQRFKKVFVESFDTENFQYHVKYPDLETFVIDSIGNYGTLVVERMGLNGDLEMSVDPEGEILFSCKDKKPKRGKK